MTRWPTTLTTAKLILALLLTPGVTAARDEPFLESELIFPLEHWHNHSSSIVELPNGDLFVAWFHGSGERRSDDVLIRGARWIKETGEWTKPFLLADTPGFPDTNCVVYLDSRDRWTRHVERDEAEESPARFHYPSVWGARDGTLHMTYSYHLGGRAADAPQKSIKHAHFNVAWIRQGDGNGR